MTNHPRVTVGERPRKYVPPIQPGTIIACAAGKGGTGKSRLAREIAAARQSVLVDLEWDWGGASRSLGYKEERRKRSLLLDAIQSKRTPKPISGHGTRPDLIPGHKDLGFNQPQPEVMAELLLQWAEELKRDLVVDTHPGGSETAFGAMMAADVVVVPVMYAVEDLNALEGFLREAAQYPVMLIPYRAKRTLTASLVRRLESLSEEYDVPIGPTVSHHAWLPDRISPRPIMNTVPSRTTTGFINEVTAVVEAAEKYVQ